MSKSAIIGLCLILTVSLAAPAWSQRGENNEYQAIRDEHNPQKRKQMIEEFIDKNKNSQFRPELDVELMNLYVQNGDWAQLFQRADRFYLEVPSADAKSRVQIYTRGMVAAQRMKNDQKVTEFAERVLQADANDLNALMTLSAAIMNKLPAEGAAKDAGLEKALGYSKRILAAPKPAGITDEDFQRTQARAHGTVGFIQLSKNQFADAAAEFDQALKVNPKDPDSQYRAGIAYFNLIVSSSIPTLQTTMKAVDDASAAKADEKKLNELLEKRNAAEKDVVEKRDLAIEALGKAVALGVTAARPQLEALYKSKTGGVETLDQFISQKKTELGL